jgi:hypothetical protein
MCVLLYEARLLPVLASATFDPLVVWRSMVYGTGRCVMRAASRPPFAMCASPRSRVDGAALPSSPKSLLVQLRR